MDGGACGWCGEEAETKCTGCRQVFYCSKACQKQGWERHKEACRPFTVTKRKAVGRLLVACRDLAVGEEILSEVPLVLGPRQDTDPQEAERVCLGCYRRISGEYKCSQCSWPLCGMKCESSPDHQPECSITRAARVTIGHHCDQEAPNYPCDLVMTLRCLVEAGRDGAWGQRWRTCTARLNTTRLQASTQQEQQDQLQLEQEHTQQMQDVIKMLREAFKLDTFPDINASDASLMTILRLVKLNQVPTKMPYAEVIGLYPMASLVSHSCMPNTKTLWKDGKLTVLASDPIAKGDPITGLYTDILWGTRARRDHLRLTRLYHCSCRRCADPTELDTNFSALVCRRCKKNVLPSNPLDDVAPWLCRGCGMEVSVKDAVSLSLSLGGTVEQALANPTIDSLEALQKEWLEKVHPNHYHLHAVKHSLLQLYGRTQEKAHTIDKDDIHWQEVDKKETACKEFLTVCSRLDPSTAHTAHYVGLTFYEYNKTILQNALRSFAFKRISRQQLKKRMLLSKALLKKTMEIFRDEAPDTPESQLCHTCEEEVIQIGKWMLCVELV
ncbi:LOW QUALITY PROTEIN: SET domain-containing protein SmydA-8-like [Portunus trituberculatus]|uniref:LOW QUALITY PROTEIN: SET domain-containing protein SmydA-8-like n=1 Tax=Portunus trituberculatus TaxID=210409 RepID=UPI001E1CB2CB|nr:LOW QUALITY PROTEIN: SET domain-containing protein SmydA-8-like [Portunus trituberculatus]